ncbi:MAG: uracil-DNA glycosylase [Myxococcota bacterium]
MSDELLTLVRQLRQEIDWAARVGVVPSAPSTVSVMEPEPEALPERLKLERAPTLEAVRSIIGDCRRCRLSEGRRQIVFGVGDPAAELMFIGEGPGADEDRQGEPFVGKAGQLLTRIIEKGMGMSRSEVYIANIVKCRPPNNRDPEPDEVESCEPFLQAQIQVVQPKVLVALGKYAAQTLLGVQTPISRLRGRWAKYQGIPLMPTFHPAYLLRNPAEKRPVWEDIQEVLRQLGRNAPGGTS